VTAEQRAALTASLETARRILEEDAANASMLPKCEHCGAPIEDGALTGYSRQRAEALKAIDRWAALATQPDEFAEIARLRASLPEEAAP
jgi:hypothetical protein